MYSGSNSPDKGFCLGWVLHKATLLRKLTIATVTISTTVIATTTQRVVSTATTTTTQIVTNWTVTGILGVLLIIGIGIDYTIKRK
jgi:uncharacterized membrane protein YdfJ with MMPL/SSD domain